MQESLYTAVDLGASSGRVINGLFNGKEILLNEIHRFTNGGVFVNDSLQWNILGLWDEIIRGLILSQKQNKIKTRSIGIDTWGVDFGLLDEKDNLIGNPFHYRDTRTNGILGNAFKKVSKMEIYSKTGIQFMEFNSLFQLYALVRDSSSQLSIADRFLNLPDLFNFFLTGEKTHEYSISTTTQFYNQKTGQWCLDLLKSFGIPNHILGEITQSGTLLGSIRPGIRKKYSLAESIKVISTAGHDTACAVAAVPAEGNDHIYISSGTWSLMGIEIEEPIITQDSLQAGMSNEGGVEGRIRFLKILTGLWLVQECLRIWNQSGDSLNFQNLADLAAKAHPFHSLIDPNDKRFMAPADMVQTIQDYCKETHQPAPLEKGAVIRCVLESLALQYQELALQIDRISGKDHPVIHIIGGGSQNSLLNQFTANATGRKVMAGPVEATVLGNILVQAISVGDISSLQEGRKIISQSCDLLEYEPQDNSEWQQAFARYLELKA